MLISIIFEFIFIVIPYVSALSPLSLTKPINDGFGVNIHFTQPKAGELEMIAAAGFKWVRQDFYWDGTEKKKGEYNFKEYEFLMSELEKHNMSAILILDYGNALYGGKSVTTEVGRKAYAQWAATAVEHFKGRGILWEIWNEPNGDGFWFSHHNVQEYAAMALEAVKAIRAKTQNELIIGPATSGVDFNFLEECFKAGLLDYWDAVSVHPYRQIAPESALNDYYELKKMIVKYGPKGKTIPIISSEWGYSAVWNGFNETIQGKFLPRELLLNVMNGIPISIWYDWHNDGTNKKEPEHNFGIVEFDYHSGANPVCTPKEAYLSAKTMYSILKGFNFVKRIATLDLNDYILLFSNGKELRLVVWSTSSKSHQIKIPSDKSDFEIVHHKGSPIEKASAIDGSLTLTLNDFTHFIVMKGPNHALENAGELYVFKVVIQPIHGKELMVKVNNIYGTAVNVTVGLTDIKGIEPLMTEQKLQFNNEFEKDIKFSLKSVPEKEFTVGLSIESHGSHQDFKAHKYQFLDNQILSNCNIAPDGDSKIKSEQSVTVHSAPTPLFDSDSPVLKIDYHFYGQGWKFLGVFPNKAENRKINGQPIGFGVWVYGDSQMQTIKMRIEDSLHQIIQIRPASGSTIDWTGWRYVQFLLNDFDSHWNGSNDGIPHYPLEFQTLFLLDNIKQTDIKSSIYISSPIVLY
jgi:hypothetical protein